MTELADAGRDRAIAGLLALRVPLGEGEICGVLEAQLEEPAPILCRAAGLSINGYSAILRMRRRKRRATALAPSALLHAYRELPRVPSTDLARLLRAAGAADA